MIAVYRNLYSHDFWAASVNSIRVVADRVIAVMHRKPYGNIDPTPFEKAVIAATTEVAHQICDEVYFDHRSTPVNQFTWILNDLIPGDEPAMVIDSDMVWRKDELAKFLDEARGKDCLMSRQIEVWKGMRHRVPERQRQGCVIWNKRPLPDTQHLAYVPGMPVSQAQVHNLGFAVSERTMRVKDSISKRMSPIIGDSQPDPEWINRWLNWKPGDTNLEISEGYQHLIPHLDPYDPKELPECVSPS